MARTESAAEVCLPKGALLIGESRLETASGGKCAHVNPATGRAQAWLPLAGPKEIDAAVAAACAAQPRWRTLTPSGRRDLLLRLASLLEQNSDELSTIVALETGTPKIASGAAPHAAADHFRYYAGWIDKIEGNVTPVDAQETLNYSVLEPYGVVAVILTWNSLSTRSGAPLRRHWQQATP